MVIGLSGVHLGLQSYFVTKNMISDRIGLHDVFLPINHKNYNLREKMITQVMKKRENLHLDWLWWLKPRLWLVDLNYNFGCNWLIELSHNKLSHNNLASKLMGKVNFWKQS